MRYDLRWIDSVNILELKFIDAGQGGRGRAERAARRGAHAMRGADAGDDAAGAGARVAAAQRQGVSRRVAVRDDERRDVRVPRAREGDSDGDGAAVPGEPGLDEPRAHGLLLNVVANWSLLLLLPEMQETPMKLLLYVVLNTELNLIL